MISLYILAATAYLLALVNAIEERWTQVFFLYACFVACTVFMVMAK